MKREKEVYRRTNCVLQVLPLFCSLCIKNWLSNFAFFLLILAFFS